MDQATWGVLIASGIGVVGVVVAAVLTPWLTARRAERARLRDERREAYAHGLRVVSEIASARDLERLRTLGQAVFEIQAQISLVGSDRARDAYNKLSETVRSIVDVIEIEGTKVRLFKTPDKIVGLAYPIEKQRTVRDEFREFLLAARADLGVEDA